MNPLKPLFIPLKGEHFDAFANGSKTHERRRQGRGWNPGTCVPGRNVVLSRGYGKAHRRYGVVLSRRVVPFSDIDESHHDALRACYGAGIERESIIEVEISLERTH